jgi:hypothetical protein
MTASKLRDWLEIIGLFSVVASLVFVGLQMKQSQEIALSQASQARTAMSLEIILSTAENPLFTSAMVKGRNGKEQSPEEQAATSQYAIAILWSYEDQHIQYSNGFLSEERWSASKEQLKRFLSESSTMPVRWAYERAPGRLSPSFRAILDELIAELDSAKEGSRSE